MAVEKSTRSCEWKNLSSARKEEVYQEFQQFLDGAPERDDQNYVTRKIEAARSFLTSLTREERIIGIWVTDFIRDFENWREKRVESRLWVARKVDDAITLQRNTMAEVVKNIDQEIKEKIQRLQIYIERLEEMYLSELFESYDYELAQRYAGYQNLEREDEGNLHILLGKAKIMQSFLKERGVVNLLMEKIDELDEEDKIIGLVPFKEIFG